MTWILTASGKHFDYADPQPDQICITDIALGLSRECRFSGQCRFFYSVAQHCLLGATSINPAYAFEMLMHDAAEAYMRDISRPLKAMLPDYKEIEERVEAVIFKKFGLPEKLSEEVKRMDLILLATEQRDLMPKDKMLWPNLEGIELLRGKIKPVDSETAYRLFLNTFDELSA